MGQENPQEPIEYQISNELDLHTFLPNELGELIPDYIGLCLEKDIIRIRIIHGKGIGTLRETVHALLKKDCRVLSFELASQEEGGWGSTIVCLTRASSICGGKAKRASSNSLGAFTVTNLANHSALNCLGKSAPDTWYKQHHNGEKF